jgi:hypothetical protein
VSAFLCVSFFCPGEGSVPEGIGLAGLVFKDFARRHFPTLSRLSANESREAFLPLFNDEAACSAHSNTRSFNQSVVSTCNRVRDWPR